MNHGIKLISAVNQPTTAVLTAGLEVEGRRFTKSHPTVNLLDQRTAFTMNNSLFNADTYNESRLEL